MTIIGLNSGSELSGLTFNARSLTFGTVHSLAFSVIPSNFASRSYPSHILTGIPIRQTPLLDIGWCFYVKSSMAIMREPSLEGSFFLFQYV